MSAKNRASTRPLSGLDAAFVYLEAAGTPMHVGGLMLLDRPKAGRAGFTAHLRAHMAQRLPKAKALRRILQPAPFALDHGIRSRPAPVDAPVARTRLAGTIAGRGGAPARQASGSQSSVVGAARDRGPGRWWRGGVRPTASCLARRPGRRGAGARAARCRSRCADPRTYRAGASSRIAAQQDQHPRPRKLGVAGPAAIAACGVVGCAAVDRQSARQRDAGTAHAVQRAGRAGTTNRHVQCAAGRFAPDRQNVRRQQQRCGDGAVRRGSARIPAAPQGATACVVGGGDAVQPARRWR